MTQGKRVGLSAAQKTDIRSRWKGGQSLQMIGRGPIGNRPAMQPARLG